jgi:hypothetical protein
MDPFMISLFVLAIIGCLWMTVYAILVTGIGVQNWVAHTHTPLSVSTYRSERQIVINKILHNIVVCETYHRYMQPLLYNKLKLWGLESLNTTCGDTTSTLKKFIAIHKSLLLTRDEYIFYKTICKNTIDDRKLWIQAHYVEEKVEDMCCNYMFHDTFHNELWDFLSNIHLN